MLANAICDNIKSIAGLVPEGFVARTGRIESDQERAIMIMLPLGGFVRTLDTGGFYRGNQQILVRSPDPLECNSVCEAVMNAMTVIGSPRNLDGYQLKLMHPRGLPTVFPINDAALWEGSINFDTYAVRL